MYLIRSLLVSVSPFDQLSPVLFGGELPTICIFIYDLEVADGNAAELRAVTSANWRPIVIRVGKRPAVPKALEVIRGIRGQPAYLSYPYEFSAAQALAAIRSRPTVSNELIAEFVAGRTKTPIASPIVGEAIAYDLNCRSSVFSRRTMTRRCAMLGNLSAKDWFNVARLAKANRDPRIRTEALAAQLRLDARTLRNHVRKYLKRSVQDYLDLPGWETILEIVLQEAEYVPTSLIR